MFLLVSRAMNQINNNLLQDTEISDLKTLTNHVVNRGGRGMAVVPYRYKYKIN